MLVLHSHSHAAPPSSGYAMVVLYFVFVAETLLLEYDVLFDPPACVPLITP